MTPNQFSRAAFESENYAYLANPNFNPNNAPFLPLPPLHGEFEEEQPKAKKQRTYRRDLEPIDLSDVPVRRLDSTH